MACVFEMPDSADDETDDDAKAYDEDGSVAVENGNAIGLLLWRVIQAAGADDYRYLGASLGVAPSARGRGCGSLLAGELQKIIQRHEGVPLRMDADEKNEAAHHLARKLGLRIDTRRMRYQLRLAERPTLSNTSYTVTKYDGQDLAVAEEIAALYTAAFRNHSPVGQFNVNSIQEFCKKSSHAMLCVWDADRLAAFAGLARHGSEGWVYWIAAGRRWWGRGASDVLSTVIYNTLLDMGCTTADAVADEKNFPSRSLMERFGLSVTSTLVRYTNVSTESR